MLLTIPLIEVIEQTLVKATGSLTLVAFGIMAFFLIGFMFSGIDFRYSILIITPLVIIFTKMGWLPIEVSGIFWVIIIGFALFIAWNYIKER